MPSRNIVKEYAADSYYHFYNRGINKQEIFRDKSDYILFLSLLKRYLSNNPSTDRYGRQNPHYKGELELLAFCLMENHFHLLIYQHSNEKAITKFAQSIATAYTMYFNRKYKRVGRLFQSTFKASRISRDDYLQHISRYIHLNPKNYRQYKWSSLPYYLDGYEAEWLKPTRILEIFDGNSYEEFLKDYEDYKEIMNEIKYELANHPSLQGLTLQ